MNITHISDGYILLARQLLNSRAWLSCNHEQQVMLIYTVLMANHKPNHWWNGTNCVEIPRGSFVTSRDKFAKTTKTSPQKVRTFWVKLEKVGFLTIQPTSKYSIVTICNYDVYQDPGLYKQPGKQPSSNQVATTNNNGNNGNNVFKQQEKASFLKNGIDNALLSSIGDL